MDRGYTILTTLVQMVYKALEFYDCDPEPLFKQAGLDPNKLHANTTRYPKAAHHRLMELAVSATEDPCFGLAIARQWHPSVLDALGYAFMVSPTLKDGLQGMVRYSRIITNYERFSLQPGGDHYRLSIMIPDSRFREIDATYDAALGMIVSMCRANYGAEFTPRRVELERQAPSCAAEFYRFFAAPIRFSAAENALILGEEELHKPLLTANEALLRVHTQFIVEHMAKLDQTSIADRARTQLLRELPAGTATAESVARKLNMSMRNFQRRLQAEGVTFQQLFDEVRRELAVSYIAEGRFSFKEITYLLGFSAPSHFSRAFKRWTGVSPSEYRPAHN